jgi:NAD(P)H-quinone oxidoreductase subunit 5
MNDFLLQTSWWVPCYGLLGALLTLPWSMGLVKRTGPRPAAYFNILMTLLAFVHGTWVFQMTWHQEPLQLVFQWLQVADLDLTFNIEISSVTVGAMELITALSIIAQVFALGYLEKDWALARFFGLMGFFEAAMSGLAISNSLFLSYALLEMLTLSTYLLVGFWYAQPLVVTAARDAFLTKRVGDILLLMGVVVLCALAGSLNYPDLYNWTETVKPFHLWLDEAMEGPNPASILRNSVVVSSGAYFLIKLQPILNLSPIALSTLVFLGCITAVGESLVAIAQVDIKRALSHSTSAYLGLVFISVGMQWTNVALLLLFTHAIAKALVFMSIGCIVYTTNSQDLTEYGGLWSKMPATTSAFVVGGSALVGLFPLGCFWSFERGLDIFWYDQPILSAILLLVNLLSALSLTRIFRLVFLGEPQPKTRRAPEVAWPMAVPMIAMIFATLLSPILMQNLSLLPDWEYVNKSAVVALIGSGAIGVLIGATVELQKSKSRSIQKPIRVVQDILSFDFYIDKLYLLTVVAVVGGLSRVMAWFDRYIVDGVVNVVGLASVMGGEGLKYSASGQSQFYVLTILLGVSVLGLLLTWSLW